MICIVQKFKFKATDHLAKGTFNRLANSAMHAEGINGGSKVMKLMYMFIINILKGCAQEAVIVHWLLHQALNQQMWILKWNVFDV